MLAALPEREPEVHRITDIVVDMGGIDHITSVSVSGNKVSSYVFEDHVLRIPNLRTDVKTLTVTSVSEDGKVLLSGYALSFKAGKGYSAYRLYTTPDLIASAKTVVTNIVKVADMVVKGIKGLFGR